MKTFKIFLFLFLISSAIAFSQNPADKVRNNAFMIRYGHPLTLKNGKVRWLPPSPALLLTYNRTVWRPGSFMLEAGITTGFVFGDGSMFYAFYDDDLGCLACPELRLNLKCTYSINKHFFSFTPGMAFNLLSSFTGHYDLEYSYFINKKYFVNFTFEHLIWISQKQYILPPTEECEECYAYHFNLWAWDLKYQTFQLEIGVGIRF